MNETEARLFVEHKLYPRYGASWDFDIGTKAGGYIAFLAKERHPDSHLAGWPARMVSIPWRYFSKEGWEGEIDRRIAPRVVA
jgi:hypothetical protein